MRAPPPKWVFIFTKVQAMDAFASVISRPWRRLFFQILRSSAKLLGVCDLLRRLYLIIVIITNLFIIIIIIALIIIIILLIIIIDTIIITISGSEQLLFRTNVGLGEGLVSSCSNADIESLSSFIIIISSEHILAQTNMSAYYIVTATFKLSTITQ